MKLNWIFKNCLISRNQISRLAVVTFPWPDLKFGINCLGIKAILYTIRSKNNLLLIVLLKITTSSFWSMFYEFQRKTVVGDENEEAGGGGADCRSTRRFLSSGTSGWLNHSSLLLHPFICPALITPSPQPVWFPSTLTSAEPLFLQPLQPAGCHAQCRQQGCCFCRYVKRRDSTSLQTLFKMKKMSQLIYVTFESVFLPLAL